MKKNIVILLLSFTFTSYQSFAQKIAAVLIDQEWDYCFDGIVDYDFQPYLLDESAMKLLDKKTTENYFNEDYSTLIQSENPSDSWLSVISTSFTQQVTQSEFDVFKNDFTYYDEDCERYAIGVGFASDSLQALDNAIANLKKRCSSWEKYEGRLRLEMITNFREK